MWALFWESLPFWYAMDGDIKEGIGMTTITIQLEDAKAASLRKIAQKFGLSPDQFVAASIEDLLSQPEPDFEAAVRKVLSKNKELYKRLA